MNHHDWRMAKERQERAAVADHHVAVATLFRDLAQAALSVAKSEEDIAMVKRAIAAFEEEMERGEELR